MQEAVALHGRGQFDNAARAEVYNNLAFAFLQLESLESALANYDEAVAFRAGRLRCPGQPCCASSAGEIRSGTRTVMSYLLSR